MEFKVLSVLKKYMTEEAFTAFEKGNDFEKALNVDIDKYITSNTPDKDELVKEAQKTAHEEVITALGITDVKTVEGLKSHIEVVGKTTTEKEKELIKVTKERDLLKVDYDKEVEARTTIEKETKLNDQMTKVKGLVGEEQAEFIHFKLSKEVTEDKPFDDVFTEYEEANPPQPKRNHVNPRFQPKAVGKGGDRDGYEIYKELKEKGKV